MASESDVSLLKGRIYIPPCKNKHCESWVLKLVETLKTDVDCIIKKPINGPFHDHFKRQFQACDFTILHYCPHLWKRISGFIKELKIHEDKMILVRFENSESIESFKETKEELIELDTFFSDFDSTEVIKDEQNILQSFKDELLNSLSDKPCQNVDIPEPHLTTRSEFSISDELEQIGEESDDKKEEDDEKFEKYTSFFCNNSQQDVYVAKRYTHVHGYKNISFDKSDLNSLKKAMDQINALKDRSEKEEKYTLLATLKYILKDVLPAFYAAKDIVRLASFSMCRHPHLHNRALDLLEFLLLEKVDTAQDSKTLIDIENTLTVALLELKHDHEKSSGNEHLQMLQRVTNIYLLVIGSIIALSHEKSNEFTKCTSYLDTRCQSCFISSNTMPQGVLFDSYKKSDGNLLLGIVDSVLIGGSKYKKVVKFAKNYLSALNNEQEYPPSKLNKKNNAEHLFVILQLLREAFLCDGQAISHLKKYFKSVDKESSPFVYLVLHSLSLFLAYKTQQVTEKDISAICEDTVSLISQIIPHELNLQSDAFLQRLLFNSNSVIRRCMIKIFKENDSYGSLMCGYMQNEMEHHLSPMLCNLDQKQVANKKAGGWRKASCQFEIDSAWFFFYYMNEKDHKEHGTTFEENGDLCYTEMKRLSCLQHKNIIKMFAYHHDSIPQCYILESCEQNLQDNLKNKRQNGCFYKPSQLLQFLMEAISALKYCHCKEFVHCNLTAESLIVVNDIVKLRSFGLCKKIEASTGKAMEINSKEIPLRWSAPESILHGKYSKASDVWMFGHLLYEVVTHGLLPYSNMNKTDEMLITLMKSKQLKLTIDPVVEKAAILQLLSECVSYDEDGRVSAVEVEIRLKNILISLNQKPERRVVYPEINNESKASTNCTRGIPKRFYIRTGVTLYQNVKQTVNYSETIDQIIMGEDFIFREKIHHRLSPAMESHFSSAYLDDILPKRRKIHQHADEMPHIECTISSDCFSLLKVALNNKVNEIEKIISFIHQVAVLLAKLSRWSFVIGDLCASKVFVELTDMKVHIISLAYLRKLDDDQESTQSNDSLKDFTNIMKTRTAPELLCGGNFSKASDVFCFGNFMWETLNAFETNSNPFLQDEVNVYKGEEADIHDLVMTDKWKQYHPKPKCCPDGLYELMKMCVDVRENVRPEMIFLSEKLKVYCKMTSGDTLNNDSHSVVVDVPNPSHLCLTEENPSVYSDSRTVSDTSNATSLSVQNPSGSSMT